MVAEANDAIKEAPFPQYPEGSDFPGVRKILEKTSAISKRSRIKTKNSLGGGFTRRSERPDALRRTRRELAEKIKFASGNERALIIEDAHTRDELAEQFISNQQVISVNLEGLGRQEARFVILTPPESKKTEGTNSKSPIFLIPGISNDLESIGMLPQEIAFSGRKLVIIAYPESWHGDVTDAFGKAAEESSNYEPHTSFFKKAIENIWENPDAKRQLGDYPQIELWGYSAGAAIASEILTDAVFRQGVSDAVLIAPPSNVDQKNLKIFNQEIPVPKAMLTEWWRVYRNFRNSAKINITNRTKVEYTMDKRKRKSLKKK